MSADVVRVAIWTDGHGSYQARCLDCSWRGPWREAGRRDAREQRAVDDAQQHSSEHVAQPVTS